MKKYISIILLFFLAVGCYEENDRVGFLSSDVYLKGPDTISLSMGARFVTDAAWLDGSSEPATFEIYDVRDESGNRSEQFFEKREVLSWVKPYDNQTDTTLELINQKITSIQIPCVNINPVNGSLEFFESSSALSEVGDVFHLDAKVSNSWGEKVYEDYAIMKLTSDRRPYKFYRATTAIILLNEGGEKTFPLYDAIGEADLDRHENIYSRNGVELIDIYKKSEEPTQGVKIIIQYKDAEGRIFNSQDYATYSTGTESYLDYAVNRQNLEEGAQVEFPTTPWPVKEDLLSYLKGATLDYSVLDTAALHQGVYENQEYPKLYDWPSAEFGATKWFVRLRSRIVFYEPGTWVISARFPYTHIDQTFD